MDIKKNSIILVLNKELKPKHLRVCLVTGKCKDRYFTIMDLEGVEMEIPGGDLLCLFQSKDAKAKTAKEAFYASPLEIIKILGGLC